jgi:hypothetical protein
VVMVLGIGCPLKPAKFDPSEAAPETSKIQDTFPLTRDVKGRSAPYL